MNPFYLELHDERPDVYRVVDGAAAERLRQLQTTARPPYIALVWGRENALIIVRALTESDSKSESAPVTLADEARCSSTVECIDCQPIKMWLQPDGTQYCGRCGLSWSADRGFYDHAKPEGET